MDGDRIVEEVNRIFHDLTAGLYDNRHPEIFGKERERIRSIFMNLYKKRMTVLDAGAGSGFVYWAVKDLVSADRFYMLDVSAGMLKIARNRCPECHYINASALSMPFKENTFDIVVFNSVLHHLPDLHTVAEEVYRILKVGGKVVINHEPNFRFSTNPILWYQFLILNGLIRWMNPVKGVKRIITRIRGARNPTYDRINQHLMSMGLIDKPLQYERISAYIDYLSPTAGYIRRGRGVSLKPFEKLFRVIHVETYDHLGKISEKFSCRILKMYEDLLKKRYVMDGSKIVAILEKI